MGVISFGSIEAEIIRIPETVVNIYSNTVPVVAIGRNAFRNSDAKYNAVHSWGKNNGRKFLVEAVGDLNSQQNSRTITDIIIPSCVSAIYQGAFADCRSLERVTIPKAVKKIEQGTFENCTALKDIYYEGSPKEWGDIEIVNHKREVEYGGLKSGSPVCEKAAERYIHIPGNEPVFSANIHFLCVI